MTIKVTTNPGNDGGSTTAPTTDTTRPGYCSAVRGRDLTHTATSDFIGESDLFQVDVAAGDPIQVHRHQQDSSWASVKNMRTGESGLVPTVIISEESKMEDGKTYIASQAMEGDPAIDELTFAVGEEFSMVVVMNDCRFATATLTRTGERGIVPFAFLTEQ